MERLESPRPARLLGIAIRRKSDPLAIRRPGGAEVTAWIIGQIP
jgi:hypothetical protein